jgi:hypothetical protein
MRSFNRYLDFGLWHFFFIFKSHRSLPTKAVIPSAITLVSVTLGLDIWATYGKTKPTFHGF